ncbi:FkbM family methyltransferase [Microcystis wesenbergii FACHB-1317]|uniref:FkbM family methyltransferase n=1 Tax=Microcystis TaxID=1125 RepID=UPI001680C106|nr:FkbM family methyltransferase [Microcystis aeruginosa]MBD2289420.1 FkbM family methyltransferase [Microcystis wesenbergii FACHB-1317]UZO75504.1 FkbM family methyltransferase [Microcystis aeruginosa str. Chao 1910]
MKTLKQLVKKIPIINDWTILLYQKLWTKQKLSTTYWIDKITENVDFKVVQIGSNDGQINDPLSGIIKRNSKWEVLFVEPVSYLFDKLQTSYPKKPRFRFENAFINDGSEQVFYWVKKEAIESLPELPIWYDQLGSLDKEHIIKHLKNFVEIEKLHPFIVEDTIQGMTMYELFQKYKIAQLYLLHIDTEGADWKILSQLDLTKYTPLIILFEHRHLQNAERESAISFLKNIYYIFQFAGDFLCVRKKGNNMSIGDLIGLRISEH